MDCFVVCLRIRGVLGFLYFLLLYGLFYKAFGFDLMSCFDFGAWSCGFTGLW